MTREQWLSFSQKEKQAEVAKYLQQLEDIATGKHELSVMDVQGKLAHIKTDIKNTLFNIFDWEKEEYEKNSSIPARS